MFRKILSFALLSLILFSCGADRTREQKMAAMMNEIKSPFFASSFNLQTLMDKSEIMKEGTIPFTYLEILSFFLESDVTGIDYGSNAHIVIGEGKSFTPGMYGFFKVGDQKKFKELIEKEAGAEIKEKEGYQYAIKEADHYCVVWKDDFAMITDIPIDLASLFSGGGKEGEKKVSANIRVLKAAEEGEIDADWEEFFSNTSDMAMRFNGAGFYNYMSVMSPDKDELEELKELYEGVNTDMFVNFTNGAVEIEMLTDLSEELKEEMSFLPENGVSDEMLQFGKSENPIVVGAYSLEPSGAMEYIEKMSPDEYNEMIEAAEEGGISIDDLKMSTSGEFVFMIEEVITKTELIDFGYGESFETQSNEPTFAIVLGLKDNAYIETELKKSMQEQMGEEQDRGVEDLRDMEVWQNGVMKVGDALIYLGEDFLFASNDTAWANLIAAGEGKTVANPDGILNSKALGMFVNLADIQSKATDIDVPAEYTELMDNLTMTANVEGGKITMNMTDKSQNALKVIVKAIGDGLSMMETQMNPEMEAELEEAFLETQKSFEELENTLDEIPEVEELEDALNDAFDELNK